MKISQNGKKILKVTLTTCAIIMILSGIALAADRDVIIGYKKSVGTSEKELVVQSHAGKVKKDFHLINAVSASVPEDKIEEMKKDSKVKYVVNDTIYRITDEYSSSWGVQYIGSHPVHNQSINGTGVKIAVLDTGIDYNHTDLDGNYKGGHDFVNLDPDPWDDNCHQPYGVCHGTHISGIIAAELNGIGVVGVAPGASIYAVKVLDWSGGGSASYILSGIEWAKDNGMNIISMSFGKDENNTAIFDAVNTAYDSGILLVASGGNTGGPVLYPAAYDSVIAVTSIDQNGQRASSSPIDQKIEVAAPGVDIDSTVCINADTTHCLQEGYGFLSGTSMAAPHVTGVAALIFSSNFVDVNRDGSRDNKDVREIIRNTAFDAGIPGKDDIYGYGIVDASKALLGTSAYPSASLNADLSITKDDGVSRIIAGDGKTYTYIITVRNNGPSDASIVQVLDTWPGGFIRGTVTTSQGTCDTAINFTCDLGTIPKDGTANINVSYTVPDASIGNYTNRVEVKSTSADNNASNNIAEDKNIVEINSSNADLSITKNDGVSRITAGDGKTYTYIITVKNNGPSVASGVKLFDTWPVGFIRGIVKTSQGTCATPTPSTTSMLVANFACDLGTIQKDKTANINVSYTVPIASIGNYTNRVEIKSTSADNNASNNIAEDKNIVEIIFNLLVNSDSSNKNAKQVSLLKGDYSITITNSTLSKIDMNVYENGVLRKDLSSKYKLKKSQVVSFNMNIVSPKLDFVFIPDGDKGSTGTVTIRRSS